MPYPFHWVPAGSTGDPTASKRHASLDTRPGGGYPTGMTVATLCGFQLSADNSTAAWTWDTCVACDAEAHRLACLEDA